MPESKIQTSFAAGELSPTLYARVDIDKFQVGAAFLRNFFVDWRGGASNRAGTKYCGKCKVNGARLIRFNFSTDITYMMEFGPQYIRFFTGGEYVTQAGLGIAGITNANPGVVNVNGHGYTTGQEVILVTPGVPQLNGRNILVQVTDANHFSMKDLFGNVIDTTSFGVYTGLGSSAAIYEVVTPYAAADLFALNFTQSADVVTLVHPNYVPYNLSRVSASTFTLTANVPGPIMQPPTNLTGTSLRAGIQNYGYVVTAVNEDGTEESIGSAPFVIASPLLDQTAAPPVSITISWTPPAGQIASAYNIYKWGPISVTNGTPPTVFGYAGQTQSNTFTDNNIAADFSKVPDNFTDPFSPGQIEFVSVVTPGAYTAGGSVSYVPLTITGDGTGAAGFAVIDYATGHCVAAFLTQNGKNYTTATITAGAGGATFSPQIGPSSGTFPSVVSYVQQRRAYFAATGDPQGYTMSQTGNYDNFNVSPVVEDSDAITGRLASTEVDYIKSATPMSTGLVLLTSGGAWLLSGGSPGAPITPSETTAVRQASHGANFLPAIVWNYDVLYMQQKGNTVRDLSFNFYLQSYVGNDRSYLSQHLFTNFNFVQWVAAEEPLKLLWIVRNDGVLLSMTYLPEQEVYGWAHHDTQGLFRSIDAVSEGTVDAVYVIVSRYVQPTGACGSGWYDYVERFDDRKFDCTEDVWFLDCALSSQKSFPNFTIYDTGPFNEVGQNIEICAPTFAYPPVPPNVGVASPVGTVLNYTSTTAPASAGAAGNFDWDNNVFYNMQVAHAGDPNYNGIVLYTFNITTRAVVSGPHAATHIADAGFNSGLTNVTAIGYDGNIYFGTGNSGWVVGRMNTTTWQSDRDFANVTLDAPGDLTVLQNGGVQFVVYSSKTSGTLGSRINVIQMTGAGVTVPFQITPTLQPDEAPGSLSPGNAFLCRGPVGKAYALVVGPPFGVGAVQCGVYAVGASILPPATLTKIGVVTPAQVHAGWTTFNIGSTLLDETDGNILVLFAGTVNVLAKINAATAAVMWTLVVGMNNQFITSRVQGGRFSFMDTGPVMKTVNTLTGALVSTVAAAGMAPNTFSTSDTTGQYINQVNTASATDWATFGQGALPPFATVGQVIQIGCGKATVTVQDSSTEVHATVTDAISNFIPGDPSGNGTPVAPGDWSIATPVEEMQNLWHLEGKQVMVVADGQVRGPFTVTNGTVNWGFLATNIVVGLAYQSQLQTLYLEAQGPNMQGKRKTVPAATLRVADSRGPKIGRTFDPNDLVEMQGLMVIPGQTPMPLVTGDFREALFSDWETTGQLCVQQDYPLPLTVLGIIPEFVRGDTQT